MSSGLRVNLIEDQTGTGNGAAHNWLGGRGKFLLQGTMGGTTATLQFLSPTGSWLDVVARTTVGMDDFFLPHGKVRILLASGSPASIYAWAIAIPPG